MNIYAYKRLPEKNEDGAALEGQEPFSSAKHPGLPSLTLHEEAVAAFWNAGYGNCGRMWGSGASSTAITLINAFNEERHRFAERIEIAEVGCGFYIEPQCDALYFAMEKAILMKRDALEEMGRLGRNYILGSFSWEGKAKEILSHLQAIPSR